MAELHPQFEWHRRELREKKLNAARVPRNILPYLGYPAPKRDFFLRKMKFGQENLCIGLGLSGNSILNIAPQSCPSLVD
jgi:hypothetical protein